MMIAYAWLLGAFLQGDEHPFIVDHSNDPTAPADSSPFWLWLIGGIILVALIVTVICFDGKGQKRPWLNQRQNFRPPEDD